MDKKFANLLDYLCTGLFQVLYSNYCEISKLLSPVAKVNIKILSFDEQETILLIISRK